jgi:hypothetical protein
LVVLVKAYVAVTHEMKLKLLSHEILWKGDRHILAGKPIERNTLDCEDIVCLWVTYDKEV